jgi:hypothetical protein
VCQAAMCTDGPLCQPGSECLQERETTIDNKERRINELRLKSKELEKIKFVLDYKCAVRGRVGLAVCPLVRWDCARNGNSAVPLRSA